MPNPQAFALSHLLLERETGETRAAAGALLWARKRALGSGSAHILENGGGMVTCPIG
jgi:hypothetical protein